MSKTTFAAKISSFDLAILAQHLSHPFVSFSGLSSSTNAMAIALYIAKGRLHYVERPQGRLVTCIRGTVWLTFDGEAQDIVLEAGESYRCKTQSRLGISAFEVATVQLA